MSAYLFTLSEYQTMPTGLKEIVITFIDKARQSNKTGVLAPSRVKKILQSFNQIMDKYGADNTLAGINAVFVKEKRAASAMRSMIPRVHPGSG